MATSTYLSFTHVAKDLDMLDADGYKAVHKMMYENYKTQYAWVAQIHAVDVVEISQLGITETALVLLLKLSP